MAFALQQLYSPLSLGRRRTGRLGDELRRWRRVGRGEAGTSGGLPAVANAVVDALSEYGIRHLEMPMTPSRIWHAIQDAKANNKSSNLAKQSKATA